VEKGLSYREAKNLTDDEAVELLESFAALNRIRSDAEKG